MRVLVLNDVEASQGLSSVVELGVLREQDVPQLLKPPELSRRDVAALRLREVAVAMGRTVRVAVAVELRPQEGSVSIAAVYFLVTGGVPMGRSTFSSRTSSIWGARFVSPTRFFLILEGGMVLARCRADRSCSAGEAAWGSCGGRGYDYTSCTSCGSCGSSYISILIKINKELLNGIIYRIISFPWWWWRGPSC